MNRITARKRYGKRNQKHFNSRTSYVGLYSWCKPPLGDDGAVYLITADNDDGTYDLELSYYSGVPNANIDRNLYHIPKPQVDIIWDY